MHHEQVSAARATNLIATQLGLLKLLFRLFFNQKRWDVGQHLEVHWKNIEEGGISQYEPDDNSYVGSARDGNGDPHVGLAPCDFE